MTRKYKTWGYWNRFFYTCGCEVDVVVNSINKWWRADFFHGKKKKVLVKKHYASSGFGCEIKDGDVADLCHSRNCPKINKEA